MRPLRYTVDRDDHDHHEGSERLPTSAQEVGPEDQRLDMLRAAPWRTVRSWLATLKPIVSM